MKKTELPKVTDQTTLMEAYLLAEEVGLAASLNVRKFGQQAKPVLALTPENRTKQRARMARTGCFPA